jgi:4-hydroxy-3-methylbut-2-enyl diphosphate reductase IspH
MRQVIQTSFPDCVSDLERPLVVGITAGASCPGNLIEETIFRFGQLRQDTMSDILSAAQLN